MHIMFYEQAAPERGTKMEKYLRNDWQYDSHKIVITMMTLLVNGGRQYLYNKKKIETKESGKVFMIVMWHHTDTSILKGR